MSCTWSVPRFATLGLVAAAACAYDARAPLPSEPSAGGAPQLSASAVAAAAMSSGTGRHIVSFSGSLPTNFAAQVTALGGKVLWVSPGSGLAAVSGLQGTVTKGPTQPVCRVGQPCSAPAQVTLVFRRTAAPARVYRTCSTATGAYRITLPAGYYAVFVRSSPMLFLSRPTSPGRTLSSAPRPSPSSCSTAESIISTTTSWGWWT